MSENSDAELKKYFEELQEKDCSFEGCDKKATGCGKGKPFCSHHLWHEFDREEQQ